MNDQILYCRDCRREFFFTVGEQEFYARHALTNPPSRCPDCRGMHKSGASVQSGSGGREQNGGGSGPRVLYPAICANCGTSTQVPFQPRPGGRPIYCSSCYQVQPRSTSFQRVRW